MKLTDPNPQTLEKMDHIINNKDQEGEEETLIMMGKTLLIKFCCFSTRELPHYVHLVGSHLQEYLEDLKEISSKVGFHVSLKLLSQDAVESHHK